MAAVEAGLRPRPEPSALTQPYWDAARRHTLVRPRCNGCGRSFFTPQIACPNCLSQDWDYVPSSGRGTVYSATIVHRAPYPGFESPYHVAIVDLEEGWQMMTNLVGAGDRPVAIGAAVTVDWLPLGDDIVLPVFRLSDGEVA